MYVYTYVNVYIYIYICDIHILIHVPAQFAKVDATVHRRDTCVWIHVCQKKTQHLHTPPFSTQVECVCVCVCVFVCACVCGYM